MNLDYATVFSLAPFINEDIIVLIGICLLIGAMAKSSQLGLHCWLPMAMEGPTPVSALIHAATMVSYTIVRNYNNNNVNEFNIIKSAPDPWFVSGFTDGEGCFLVSITENKNSKLGWQVRLYFSIGLHIKDKPLLEQIKILLRHVGSITKHGPQSLHLQVQSIKELKIIIDHFDKFPLLTKKRADFELLKRVYIKMKREEHLTLEGLRKSVALRASMNHGLSEKL